MPIVETSSTPIPTTIPTIEPTSFPEETAVPGVAVTPVPTPELSPTPTNEPVLSPTPSSDPGSVVGTEVQTGVALEEMPTQTPPTVEISTETSEADAHLDAVVVENPKTVSDFEVDLSYQTFGSAELGTNKSDYSPTDTVIISGTGFAANGQYTLVITSEVDAFTFSDEVTSDELGNLLYTYQLDGTYRPDYKVEVKDGDMVIAATTFTDSDSGFRQPTNNINAGWNHPERVYTSDNNRATADFNSDIVQYYGFNFSIPDGASINGIEVSVEGYTSGSRQADISLSWNNGVNYTSAKTTNMPGSNSFSEAVRTFGGSNDLWGRSWVANDFTNSHFRLELDATGGSRSTIYIDQLRVKIYYTEIPSDVTPPKTTIDSGPEGDVNSTSATFTFSANEPSIFQCSLDSSDFTDCVSPKSYGGLSDGGHNFQVRAVDTAGNIDLTPASRSWTVDTASPEAVINYSTTDFTNGSVIATLVPLESVTVTNNEGQLFYIFTDNGSFTFDFVDSAGNTGSVVAEVGNIDKDLPTGSWVTPLDGSIVSGVVNLNFSAADEISGVGFVTYQYKREDGDDTFHETGADWDTTALPLDTYTLRAIVTDNAENTENFDETVGVSAVVSDESSTTPSDSSAVISWTTDRPTMSRVVYDAISHPAGGEEPNYGYTYSTGTFDTDKVLTHVVTIPGLSDGTVYYYRVVSEGSPVAVGQEKSFKTLTIAGAPAPSDVSVPTVLGTAAVIPLVQSGNGEQAVEESPQPEVLAAETENLPTPMPTLEPEVKGTLDSSPSDFGRVAIILAGFGLVLIAIILAAGRKKN